MILYYLNLMNFIIGLPCDMQSDWLTVRNRFWLHFSVKLFLQFIKPRALCDISGQLFQWYCKVTGIYFESTSFAVMHTSLFHCRAVAVWWITSIMFAVTLPQTPFLHTTERDDWTLPASISQLLVLLHLIGRLPVWELMVATVTMT